MEPVFLTVIIRSYKCPLALRNNIKSLKFQTDQDYEYVVIIDRKGMGLAKADQALEGFQRFYNGKYIFVLDADDMLFRNDFVSDMKRIVKEKNEPDGIIFRGIIHPYGKKDPLPRINDSWGKTPVKCQIGSFCYILKNEIFKKYSNYCNEGCVSDFYFINEVYKAGHKLEWINKIYPCTQIKSRGKGIDVNDSFKDIRSKCG